MAAPDPGAAATAAPRTTPSDPANGFTAPRSTPSTSSAVTVTGVTGRHRTRVRTLAYQAAPSRITVTDRIEPRIGR